MSAKGRLKIINAGVKLNKKQNFKSFDYFFIETSSTQDRIVYQKQT